MLASTCKYLGFCLRSEFLKLRSTWITIAVCLHIIVAKFYAHQLEKTHSLEKMPNLISKKGQV